MEAKAYDKMILAIIQDDSYQDAVSELNENGFYATILHSSGGFLKKQSVTIMIGFNHEDLENVLKILKGYGERTVIQQQAVFIGGTPHPQPLAATIPVPVHCGGVVLFVLNVERHERY